MAVVLLYFCYLMHYLDRTQTRTIENASNTQEATKISMNDTDTSILASFSDNDTSRISAHKHSSILDSL